MIFGDSEEVYLEQRRYRTRPFDGGPNKRLVRALSFVERIAHSEYLQSCGHIHHPL